MRKFKKPRKLNTDQFNKYTMASDLYSLLIKQASAYPEDPDIQAFVEEINDLKTSLDTSREEYINNGIEYEFDLDTYEEFKRAVENFKQSIALS